jgi:hypothetical protein
MPTYVSVVCPMSRSDKPTLDFLTAFYDLTSSFWQPGMFRLPKWETHIKQPLCSLGGVLPCVPQLHCVWAQKSRQIPFLLHTPFQTSSNSADMAKFQATPQLSSVLTYILPMGLLTRHGETLHKSAGMESNIKRARLCLLNLIPKIQ